MASELPEIPKNIPPKLWAQLKAFAVEPTGAEVLRPLLKILAYEIFFELSGLKTPANDLKKIKK